MNFRLIFNTVKKLQPIQVIYQIKYRLHRARYRFRSPTSTINDKDFTIKPSCIKYTCYEGFNLSFLNISDSFESWNQTEHGMLWAYNLNYMDYLLQKGMSKDDGLKLILKFIDELPNNKVGLDPYPIALRGINWIKWMGLYGKTLDVVIRKKIIDSLYSQYVLLSKNLEYHLLGNHLLEDAFSLTIASIYFSDKKMWSKASNLLLNQLKEQVLSDGAHYEQSPMYHCILLDRLLDVYNVSISNPRFGIYQRSANDQLLKYASQMLGHLECIIWSDGTLPLLNDSAYGIAPTYEDIKEYASSLGIEWGPIPMKESGYRRIRNQYFDAIIDIGNITAAYQPGHTHADTFNYELRIDGKPLVIDTGISTYDKTKRRQYERSTMAHNTVTVDNKDTSEVWGGFRVGRRAKVAIDIDDEYKISAHHNGLKPYIHKRDFEMEADSFKITDWITPNIEAISRIHLDPNEPAIEITNNVIRTNRAIIEINGALTVNINKNKASKEYNRFNDIDVIEITFKGEMNYTITRIS